MSERRPNFARPEEGGAQPQIERRLAAILAADFAGYSRLMHEDEERTLTALTSLRRMVDQLIVDGKGKIFNTAGDSVLAEFPSVVEAYRTAVAIQQTIAKANAGIAEDARMEMRIGINVGDVMVTRGRHPRRRRQRRVPAMGTDRAGRHLRDPRRRATSCATGSKRRSTTWASTTSRTSRGRSGLFESSLIAMPNRRPRTSLRMRMRTVPTERPIRAKPEAGDATEQCSGNRCRRATTTPNM